MSGTATVGGQQVQVTKDRDFTRYARAQITANADELARIRQNSALPKDAWESLDQSLYPVFDEQLQLFSDLRGAGLTTSESIFDKEVTWTPSDTVGDATIAMEPETHAPEASATFGRAGAPMPMIMADHSVGMRDEGGDMAGVSIEGLEAEQASRSVAKTAEKMCLNGWEKSIASSDRKMYGLTNHPDLNSGTLGDWDTNPGTIRSDLRMMARAIKNENEIPPGSGYWTYLSSDLADNLDDVDPEGSGDLLVRDRVENLSDLGRINKLDFLPDGSALMFAPRRDVVHLAIAENEQTVQWDDPFRTNFRTMMCFAICVKSTMANQSGVSFYTQ